jgi:hypothetical protein
MYEKTFNTKAQKRKPRSPEQERGSSMANHTERTNLKPRENFN